MTGTGLTRPQRRIVLVVLGAVVALIAGTAAMVALTRTAEAPNLAAVDPAAAVNRCTTAVLSTLRVGNEIGIEKGLGLNARLYGSESTEYRAFLAAVQEDGFVDEALAHGRDAALTKVTEPVRARCTAGTPAPPLVAPVSTDPCVHVVLDVYVQVVASGDYVGASGALISEFGVQSREFAAFGNTQPAFVIADLARGRDRALQEILPTVETICAGREPAVEQLGTRRPAAPRATASGPSVPDPSLAGVPGGSGRPCMEQLSALLADVVEGRITAEQGYAHAPDDSARERLRTAIDGEQRYEADGLSRADALTAASDAFSPYCGLR
jgi:hypothetical protein